MDLHLFTKMMREIYFGFEAFVGSLRRSKEEMRENEILSRDFLIDVSAIGSDAFGQNSSRNTLQNSPSGPESKLAGAQLDATC